MFLDFQFIVSDSEFDVERNAREYCKNKHTREYELAKAFCTDRIRKCGKPNHENTILVLNGDKYHDYRNK
jgi:hypothetical protein